jgi:excisionase family DNA binding protein
MSYVKDGVKWEEVRDIAARYNFCVSHVRDLARTKRIPSVKVGRRYYFNPREVDKHLVQDNTSKDELSEVLVDDRTEDLLADL